MTQTKPAWGSRNASHFAEKGHQVGQKRGVSEDFVLRSSLSNRETPICGLADARLISLVRKDFCRRAHKMAAGT